jgi:hypothetical protein
MGESMIREKKETKIQGQQFQGKTNIEKRNRTILKLY